MAWQRNQGLKKTAREERQEQRRVDQKRFTGLLGSSEVEHECFALFQALLPKARQGSNHLRSYHPGALSHGFGCEVEVKIPQRSDLDATQTSRQLAKLAPM